MQEDRSIDINADSLRAILGEFATGVLVMTARRESEPLGITVNSFTSVSLDPPLVLCCLANDSHTAMEIAKQEEFAFNVVASGAEAVARHFARRGAKPFTDMSTRPGLHGSPLLFETSTAALECANHETIEAGDHTIVIGRVVAIHKFPQTQPLIFVRGEYRTVQ